MDISIKEPNCPMDEKRWCSGFKGDGCCCVTPDRQLAFSVNQRDTHHWDVYTDFGRAFRIRGEPGKIWVSDERKKHPDRFDPDRKNYEFRSVSQAMAWCADELMFVRNPPPVSGLGAE